MKKNIRPISNIMIVDDDAVAVMALEEALSDQKYEIVGTAATAAEAVEMEARFKPDLVLMDIRMPGEMDGISAAAAIQHRHPIPIIFVTGHDDDELLERASRLNPSGYIMKPFTGGQITSAVEIALRARNEQERQAAGMADPWDLQLAGPFQLTALQTRVAHLVKMGRTSKEIAAHLNIAKKTVDWHRNNIRKKLGLSEKESLFSFLLEAFSRNTRE